MQHKSLFCIICQYTPHPLLTSNMFFNPAETHSFYKIILCNTLTHAVVALGFASFYFQNQRG